eukprot:884978_1
MAWLGINDTTSKNWTDYTAELRLRIHAGNEAGLILRAQTVLSTNDDGDYFYLAINAATDYLILGRMNGAWNLLYSENVGFDINVNTNYTLRAVISGSAQNKIDVYLDNVFMWNYTVTDSNFLIASGSVGIRTFVASADFYSLKISFESDNRLYTASPTPAPTNDPTAFPTDIPTASPTHNPTAAPSNHPSSAPSHNPTNAPTENPTLPPTAYPSAAPSKSPTHAPTGDPSSAPTSNPTRDPSTAPTENPTSSPSDSPSNAPTINPTHAPTSDPSSAPTDNPSSYPSTAPTRNPSNAPSDNPTSSPSGSPSNAPTINPTPAPTSNPSNAPTANPTSDPSSAPTRSPAPAPTNDPTRTPTGDPTPASTMDPTSANPTPAPSSAPSLTPTANPTSAPTENPTSAPSSAPSSTPTAKPTPCPDYSHDSGHGTDGFNNDLISNITNSTANPHNNFNKTDYMKETIKCRSGSNCIIKCGDIPGCLLADIDISNASNEVVIRCYGELSCFRLTITTNDTTFNPSVTVVCEGTETCSDMQVNIANFSAFNLYCLNKGACNDAVINLNGSSHTHIDASYNDGI